MAKKTSAMKLVMLVLQKVLSATSDSGKNMVNALRSINIPVVLGCLAHMVHLGVDKGLKSARISRVLAEVRRVVKHFN